MKKVSGYQRLSAAKKGLHFGYTIEDIKEDLKNA
jgi:hypothetical protein